ncbi:SpoIIE family protein phosphatase [Streptomyces sp. NPDC005141]
MPSMDLFALVDEGGRVIEWSRPAEELFGRSSEEAVGRPVTALMSELAAEGQWRYEGPSEDTAVLVKPVLRGNSVLWQVRAAADTPSRQGEAILRAVFTQFPVGLYVLDDHLRVVRTSATTRGLNGMPAEHSLGKHFTEVYDLADPEEETVVARRVLEHGEPVVKRLVRGTPAPGRSRRRVHAVSYFRLEDSAGNVLGLLTFATDVTERENVHDRQALLDKIRARVRPEPAVGTVCRDVVEATVPEFAGTAVVDVVEAIVCGEEPPVVPAHQDTPLRRAAFKGSVSHYPVGEVRPLPAGTPFSGVLSDLRPRLVLLDEDSSWLAADPVRADLINRSGARSLIVAPLTLHDRALGVVTFYRDQRQDPFEEEDVAVASAVCAHAALCIDNASRYMREWVVASTVQRRLLPQHPATQDTLDISHLYVPDPEGGGAWFDVIDLPGARTALIVGDVTGQGITVAITMGLLRTAIHTLAALDLQVDELLARLSDTTARLAAAYAAMPPADRPHGEPITAACAIVIYDPVDLTCTIARAGLPEPVVILPGGTSADLSVPLGPLLAETSTAPFPSTTVDLPLGSTLAMGTATLGDEVLSPSGRLRPLLDSAGGRPQDDVCADIANELTGGEALLLLARTKPLPSERVLTCDLPADPEAAPIARAAVRRQLQLWGTDEETAYTTELIASELVGNAVRYGAPPLRLRLINGRMLTCEVSDSATSSPHVKHARTVDETGRGLFIIASLAEQWGARYQEQGKSVWAELPTEESAVEE